MIINKQITYIINKDKNLDSSIISTSLDLKINDNHEQSMYLIHKALKWQLNQKRQGNAHTKTRKEVRGGGRKPWKQKGTGRARAGSNRSPLWKGGGVIFGPKSKIYQSKINKKEKRLAIQTLIYNKFPNTFVIDDIFNNLAKPSTKIILNKVKQLNINIDTTKKILIITANKTDTLYRSIRNLANVDLVAANHINILSLLKADIILMTIDSINIIHNMYNYNNEQYKS
uniref:Large ribosomal subunit protein uL4c n=1 Tax=Plumaria plumosa TaxID=189642 RepID=A0A4D6WZG9_9FLOR|nr:ribosomal protein L4 [Plumaria plumosa]